MRMGACPDDCELAELAENTYYVCNTGEDVRRGLEGDVVPSHGRGGGERWG